MKYRVEMQMKDRKYAWTDKNEFVNCVAELKVFLKECVDPNYKVTRIQKVLNDGRGYGVTTLLQNTSRNKGKGEKKTMRILVDEMPSRQDKCPYYRCDSCADSFQLLYERHICMWNNSNHSCEGVSDCPYFVAFEDKFEDKIDEYDVSRKDTSDW